MHPDIRNLNAEPAVEVSHFAEDHTFSHTFIGNYFCVFAIETSWTQL